MRPLAVAVALVLSLLPFVASAADPDPCQLVTSAEVASHIGANASPGVRAGPAVDEELRGKAWTCEQQVGKAMLAIGVVEFASPAAAAQGMAAMMKSSKETPEAMKLAPATGLGEQAAWGASPEGAIWVVLKGKHMLSMTMAGHRDPSSLREPLRRLTALALARL
jgi:hypothetical protein